MIRPGIFLAIIGFLTISPAATSQILSGPDVSSAVVGKSYTISVHVATDAHWRKESANEQARFAARNALRSAMHDICSKDGNRYTKKDLTYWDYEVLSERDVVDLSDRRSKEYRVSVWARETCELENVSSKNKQAASSGLGENEKVTNSPESTSSNHGSSASAAVQPPKQTENSYSYFSPQHKAAMAERRKQRREYEREASRTLEQLVRNTPPESRAATADYMRAVLLGFIGVAAIPELLYPGGEGFSSSKEDSERQFVYELPVTGLAMVALGYGVYKTFSIDSSHTSIDFYRKQYSLNDDYFRVLVDGDVWRERKGKANFDGYGLGLTRFIPRFFDGKAGYSVSWNLFYSSSSSDSSYEVKNDGDIRQLRTSNHFGAGIGIGLWASFFNPGFYGYYLDDKLIVSAEINPINIDFFDQHAVSSAFGYRYYELEEINDNASMDWNDYLGPIKLGVSYKKARLFYTYDSRSSDSSWGIGLMLKHF